MQIRVEKFNTKTNVQSGPNAMWLSVLARRKKKTGGDLYSYKLLQCVFQQTLLYCGDKQDVCRGENGRQKTKPIHSQCRFLVRTKQNEIKEFSQVVNILVRSYQSEFEVRDKDKTT